jgi:hypothetical protein
MTTTTSEGAVRPVTFRLPRPGVPDPFFGFSRSFYYQLEKRGAIKLVRITDGGKRGVTLVPFDAVAAFIRAQMEEQNGPDSKGEFESSAGTADSQNDSPGLSQNTTRDESALSV